MSTPLHLFLTFTLLPLLAYAGMDLTNYKLTFNQDFTTQTNLSVVSGYTKPNANTTWIAHKPDGEDWCNFEDPHGYLRPFGLVNHSLVIRSYGENNTLHAGLLSSVDQHGVGFSQKYGYFEMMGKLPKGPGTWPAFWLMDVASLVNRSMDAHEIDVLEQYGDAIGILRTTLHFWSNHNSSRTWGQGWAVPRCSMTEGMHSYGFDMQADTLTFYYDRQMILQVPNAMPDGRGVYDRAMYLMVNLAYGGGGSGNNISYILNHEQLMYVQYVRAWQGQGGSAHANDTSQAPALYYWTAGLTLTSPNRISFLNTALTLTSQGNLQVLDTRSNQVLWGSNFTGISCGSSGCSAVFQNDGNFLLHDGTGKVYWGSNTWGDNEGSMTVQGERPYIKIYDGDCGLLWSSDNVTAWYHNTAAPNGAAGVRGQTRLV